MPSPVILGLCLVITYKCDVWHYNPSIVAAATAAQKKSDDKFIKLQAQIRNAANQNQKRVSLGRSDDDSQVNDFVLASDNQTYLYAAGLQAKDIGQEEAAVQGGK